MQRFSLFAILLALVAPGSAAAQPAPLLLKIQAVGKEGQGNLEAAKAWKDLVQLGSAALLDTLQALDQADATATNWLRSAVETIADREFAAGGALPAAKLEAFIKDTRHSSTGRRLAYECLVRVDSKAPERLLPGMLDDPSAELRRDAVAVQIKKAQEALAKKEDAQVVTKLLQSTLSAARDQDQVATIVEELKKLGVEVNIPTHFGIVQRWLLIGPFDNTGKGGFQVPYPPEKRIDLAAGLPGKNGLELRWKEFTTTDAYGKVDLNKVIGKNMGAVAYAFAAIDSPAERPVEIRAATPNAVKLFLNGKEVFFREEYHHGNRFDQHVGRGTLKAGRNKVLIKVCQNEQTDDWAQTWSFQLRLCDAIGGSVPMKVLEEKPARSEEKK